MTAMALHDLPELGGEGREVVDAALHLINEEMQIAERLERKAREQWQLVAFSGPLAVGGGLTAAASTQGVGKGWFIAIGVLSLVTIGSLLVAAMRVSAMAGTRKEEGLDPDILTSYVTDLHERRSEPSGFDQVRADLVNTFVDLAKSRAESNDVRRRLLKRATQWSRIALLSSMTTLFVATLAVVVNA